MIFLNILTGSQTGNFISLSQDQVITLSSSFGSDVYLLLPDNQEFDGQLQIDDSEHVMFLSATEGLLVNNQPLKFGESYQLPCFFNIGSVTFAISKDQQISLEDYVTFSNLDIEMSEDDSPSADELRNMGISTFEAEESKTNLKHPWINKQMSRLTQSGAVNFLVRVLHHPVVLSWFSGCKLVVANFLSFCSNYYHILLKKMGYWLYFISGITLIVVLGTVFSLLYLHKQDQYNQKIEHTQTIKSKLQQQLIKLPNKYSNLKVIKANQGFMLSGVVFSESDIGFLKKTFSPLDANLKYDLLIFSRIKSQLLNIMQQHKMIRPDVGFQDDSGSVSLSGITTMVQTIDDLEISITNQFSKVGQIDASKVFVVSEIENDLNNIISNGNYKSHLDVVKNYREGKILISGYLPANDINNLMQLVEQFNQKYSPVIVLELRVEDIVNAIPFKIVEIYYGSPSYIVTGEGVRLYPGGSYDGLTLIQIDKDKLSFQGKYLFTVSNRQLLEGEKHVSEKINLDYSNNKLPLIDQEKKLESNEINDKVKQLQALQSLLAESANRNYSSVISPLIKELKDELKEKQHEYNYYFEKKS